MYPCRFPGDAMVIFYVIMIRKDVGQRWDKPISSLCELSYYVTPQSDIIVQCKMWRQKWVRL